MPELARSPAQDSRLHRAICGKPFMVTGPIQRRRRARRRSSNSSRTRPDWPTGSGINTDWLGKVVEAASGVTLDVAVKEGITGAIYTQFLPFVTPEAMKMYNDFEKALYASR